MAMMCFRVGRVTTNVRHHSLYTRAFEFLMRDEGAVLSASAFWDVGRPSVA